MVPKNSKNRGALFWLWVLSLSLSLILSLTKTQNCFLSLSKNPFCVFWVWVNPKLEMRWVFEFWVLSCRSSRAPAPDSIVLWHGAVHIRLNRRNAQPARSVSVVPLPSLHCAPPPPLFYWYLLHPFWSISPWMFDAAGSRSHKQFVSEGWSLQCHLPSCWPVQHCPGLGVTTGTALAVLGGPPWCQKTSPPPYRTRCRGLGIPKYPPWFWVLGFS